MNFDLDIGQWIVIVLSAILVAWFFAANAYNRRLGVATYRWLYQALQPLGTINQAEWIGASNAGARLRIEKANKPYRRIEAVYLLEPREFPPYWLFSRLRGKQDEVVVKLTLRAAPKTTLHIMRKPGHLAPETSSVESNVASKSDHSFENNYTLVSDGPEDARILLQIKDFLRDHQASVNTITLQREAPHLVIHSRLKPLLSSSVESYFSPLPEWFQNN